jgi:hypothetical protein
LDKQAMESDMKSLKQELVIMKLETERREAEMKNEIKTLKDQIEMSSRA